MRLVYAVRACLRVENRERGTDNKERGTENEPIQYLNIPILHFKVKYRDTL